MNINIKATNTTLTDGMRAGITQKLEVLDKLMKEDSVLYVEIEVDKRHQSGEVQRVELRVQPQGHYAEASGGDFYEALDLALPKLREQITRQKDKRISLRRKLGALFKRGR